MRVFISFLLLFVFTFHIRETLSAKANLIDIYRKEVFEYAVLRNSKPVIVFYTAKSSCSICGNLQKRLEEFAKEHNDKMYLAMVDFDKKPELKEHFGIKRLPTTRTFVKGKMIDEINIPVWPAVEAAAQKLLK